MATDENHGWAGGLNCSYELRQGRDGRCRASRTALRAAVSPLVKAIGCSHRRIVLAEVTYPPFRVQYPTVQASVIDARFSIVRSPFSEGVGTAAASPASRADVTHENFMMAKCQASASRRRFPAAAIAEERMVVVSRKLLARLNWPRTTIDNELEERHYLKQDRRDRISPSRSAHGSTEREQ